MFKSRKTLNLVTTLIIIFGCQSCSSFSTDEAVDEVAELHQRFNDRDFRAIMINSAVEHDTAEEEDAFLNMMEFLRSKLGAFVSGDLIDWAVRNSTEESTVNLTFQSTFENGTGVESIIFIKTDGGLRLKAFTVDSPVFAVNQTSEDT